MFQLLTSVFDVIEEIHVTIKSYINNLHSVRHRDLYQLIANIFASAISAINGALSEYASSQRMRLQQGIDVRFREPRI